MEENKTAMLARPIDQLPISQECKSFLKRIEIRQLSDIIDLGWQNLRTQTNFDFVRFNELISLLRENELLYLMESPL